MSEKTHIIEKGQNLFEELDGGLEEDFLDEELEGEIFPKADFYTSSGEALYERYRVKVDQGQTLLRIDKFLVDRLPGASRNRIQQAADSGFIRVLGKPVKSNYRVKPNDEIILAFRRPPRILDIEPEDIPIDVIYEDEYLLVVNKPSSLVVHPGNGNWSGTLLNALAYYLRNDKYYDPNDPCLGLVHRIDKDTSGLLLVAKQAEAKAHLAKQFFNKTTERTYQALVWGRMEETQGRIEGNIGRDPKNRLLMKCFPPDSVDGKPAVTHYKKIEQFAHCSLVECRLETGRTHQIRVHMKHIGHPLFADARYGGDKILRGQETAAYRKFIHHCFELCHRQALHAKTLGFQHPNTGEFMRFDSEIPIDMKSLIETWRTYTNSLLQI